MFQRSPFIWTRCLGFPHPPPDTSKGSLGGSENKGASSGKLHRRREFCRAENLLRLAACGGPILWEQKGPGVSPTHPCAPWGPSLGEMRKKLKTAWGALPFSFFYHPPSCPHLSPPSTPISPLSDKSPNKNSMLACFRTCNLLKDCKYPSKDKWVNTMCYVRTTESY